MTQPRELSRLPMMPLRDIVVFPGILMPLFAGRSKSIKALEDAMSNPGKEILLVAQKNGKQADPSPQDLYSVGTVCTIVQFMRLPDGNVKLLVEGVRRAKAVEYIMVEDYYHVAVEDMIEDGSDGIEDEALRRSVKMSFDHYVRLNKRIPPETLLQITQIEDESSLADNLAAHLTTLKLEEKQALLEQANPCRRLEKIYGFIQSEIEIMRVEKRIRSRVKRQMEKSQKEYYLNEQMSAIQKELGDKEDHRAEFQEIERAIKQKKLSDEAREKLNKELRKLRNMPAMSAEATVVRTYIDTVLSLPWGEYTTDKKDVQFAEEVLNKDHFGLEKVKDRILEYLSVRVLVENPKGPILCLVGPPGVGKTSLAKSIADATGRKFVRIALGGVRDEAEIRGHRRTYIGSMPGKIINAIKKSGVCNPVILLDEVDKLSSDHRGDPTAAMLEVLDPEQNVSFVDHYLDLDFDLSKVLFLATANTLKTISRPLLDRMEIIQLSGYTEEEKLAIAKQYLVPKQLKTNGLGGYPLTMSNAALAELVRYYTRESGVRNLEREIGTVLRKIAHKSLQKKNADPKSLQLDAETVTDKAVQKYLGARRYSIGLINKDHEVGICTGLAWTEVGGDLLMAEVTILPGKGKVTLTGKLGEVMQESAKAALSYVRSRAKALKLEDDFYEKIDIHVHFPAGAIPKDGPSAGTALATALTSALTKRAIYKDVAMTGEITLRGRVLPIGGLKEKLIAAHRGGIKKALIPKENEKDLEDVPKAVLKELEVICVEHMDEVLHHALVWDEPPTEEKVQF